MTHSVEVENKFEMSRGDILVRRKSFEGTIEEQRISCPVYGSGAEREESRMVKLSLGAVEGEDDYLEISVDNQQEELGPCKIEICSTGPVTFIPPAAAVVTVLLPKDVETLETNTRLRIPSGLPTWKLEIMRPHQSISSEGDAVSGGIYRDEGSTTNVKVGDAPPGGWD